MSQRGVGRDKIEFALLIAVSLASAGAAALSTYLRVTPDENGNKRRGINLHDAMGADAMGAETQVNAVPSSSSDKPSSK